MIFRYSKEILLPLGVRLQLFVRFRAPEPDGISDRLTRCVDRCGCGRALLCRSRSSPDRAVGEVVGGQEVRCTRTLHPYGDIIIDDERIFHVHHAFEGDFDRSGCLDAHTLVVQANLDLTECLLDPGPPPMRRSGLHFDEPAQVEIGVHVDHRKDEPGEVVELHLVLERKLIELLLEGTLVVAALEDGHVNPIARCREQRGHGVVVAVDLMVLDVG